MTTNTEIKQGTRVKVTIGYVTRGEPLSLPDGDYVLTPVSQQGAEELPQDERHQNLSTAKAALASFHYYRKHGGEFPIAALGILENVVEGMKPQRAASVPAEADATQSRIKDCFTPYENEQHRVIESLQKKLMAMQVNRNEWKKIAEAEAEARLAATVPQDIGRDAALALVETLSQAARDDGWSAGAQSHNNDSDVKHEEAKNALKQAIAELANRPAKVAQAALEEAAQACDQQADGTNGPYRSACLACANTVRELRDAILAANVAQEAPQPKGGAV